MTNDSLFDSFTAVFLVNTIKLQGYETSLKLSISTYSLLCQQRNDYDNINWIIELFQGLLWSYIKRHSLGGSCGRKKSVNVRYVVYETIWCGRWIIKEQFGKRRCASASTSCKCASRSNSHEFAETLPRFASQVHGTCTHQRKVARLVSGTWFYQETFSWSYQKDSMNAVLLAWYFPSFHTIRYWVDRE